MENKRFTDQHYRLSDFEKEIWVVCPNCDQQATAFVNREKKEARLHCLHCGQNKMISTQIEYKKDRQLEINLPAHAYFKTELWFQHHFRQDIFFAYNPEHLHYLEQYIGAKIREHKDRTHFTLLEKLPKFYHEAKNREALLKLIQKLKNKS